MSKRGQGTLLGVLLAALVLSLLKIAWPFVSSLVLAAMVAIMMHPANKRLSRRLRRPGLASLLTTTATVVVLGAPLVLACVTVVKSAKAAYKTAQHSLDESANAGTITSTTDRIVDAISTRLPVPKETIRNELNAGMKTGAQNLVNVARGLITGTTSIVVTAVFAAIFLFYLLRYGEGWVVHAAELMPFGHDTSARLFRTAHHSIIANIHGVFGVALAQGFFLGLGFWLVGIDFPFRWGVFGAIASIVPFVGATLIWVPAVIVLVFTGAYWKALVLGLWGGLVVGSLDNIIRPWIVGSRENQNPVLVGFAMLGGTYAFGPLGLLFGPLVVSLTGAVISELRGLRTAPKSDESDEEIGAGSVTVGM
jgi:predicted PurR-regulated permease PerM